MRFAYTPNLVISIECGMEAPVEQRMEFDWSDGTGESEFNSLLGKRVCISGLKARPELNGRTGRVFVWDEHKGRAGVSLDDEEHQGLLAIKPENLSLAPPVGETLTADPAQVISS